jgi:ABC-type nitrate/sulfonate/bicarbonate transport system substrate-binding protein
MLAFSTGKSRSSSKTTASVLIVLLALMFMPENAAPFVTSPVFAQKPLTPITLQLKWQHQFQFAGYYAALEHGYYQQVGLDVTIVEATSADEASAKVLAGEADFGIAMSDLVLLRSEGHPVVALATIYQHSPW